MSIKIKIPNGKDAYLQECEIPLGVIDAVALGKATINLSISKYGIDCWVRSTDPREYHVSMTADDASVHFAKHSQSGVNNFASPPSSPDVVKSEVELEKRRVSFSREAESCPGNDDEEDKDQAWATKLGITRDELVNNKERLLNATRTGGFESYLLNGEQYKYCKPYDPYNFVSQHSWVLRHSPRMRHDMWVPKLQNALAIVDKRKLNWHKVNGIKQQYPADSLVTQDFSRVNELEFKSRVVAVANQIGSAKAWNRIKTDPSLSTEWSVVNLEDWWRTADENQRFKILVKESRAPTATFGSKSRLFQCKKRLDTIDCPFQAADGNSDSE